ncbi:MAG: response regulator [Pseudomonadales bacterium]
MPTRSPLGIFVCDDHAAIRLGLKSILEGDGREIIGSVGSVDECLAFACHDDVGIYIVGLNIGETRGTTIVDLLRERNRRARIIVYSEYESVPIISGAYEAGARAYVNKSSEPELLLEAINVVSEDNIYFAPGVAEQLAIFYTSGARQVDPRNILTERELTIFVLLAEGHTVKEVGALLGVTGKSIGNRAVTIRQKLHIPRDQFTSFAQEHNLIETEPARPVRLNTSS